MVWFIGAYFRVLLSMEWIGLPEKCGFSLKDKIRGQDKSRKLNGLSEETFISVKIDVIMRITL
jgi:hypothetical protein